MEEEIKVKFKLEKYVVLPGKLARYHTEGFLGEGCYGRVVKCTKLDTNEAVAVKVMHKDRFRDGKKEATMLKEIQKLDPEKNNLLRFIENFKYKGHFFLVFEMLDVSIYDFMRRRNFAPLHLSEIRVVTQQLLVALNTLKNAGLVHTDIKPDNIMLVNHESQPFKVKLIDFGLAVKVSKLWFPGTIQAIGYRAPEVILGLPLDESVDMWALGCCLAYMYLGYNLYPTHCEYEVIRAIVQIHGQPRDDMLNKAMDVEQFFTKLDSSDRMFRLNTPAEYTNATGFATQHKSIVYKRLHSLDDLLLIRPKPKDPAEREDSLGFISLLKQMLLVDSNVRITPTEALAHCFITMQHLSDERNSPHVPSAWKMATCCQLRAFAAEHYDTCEAVRRKMPHAKQDGETRGAANGVADKEWIRRTLIKVSLCCAACQDGSDQSDAAAVEDKEQIGKTFIKARPSFAAHQESVETADKPAGKSKYTPLGNRGGNRCQRKRSESDLTGKAPKHEGWKEWTIIKVKPYCAADEERKDRAYKRDVLSGKARVSATAAGTAKKPSAAEREATFCKEGKPAYPVEVKTRKKIIKRAWNFLSRRIPSISCSKGCE